MTQTIDNIIEKLEESKKSGASVFVELPFITFLIHPEPVPEPTPKRPKEVPALKDSGVDKVRWRLAKARGKEKFIHYNRLRLMNSHFNTRAKKISRIISMLRKYDAKHKP